ncbi:DUF305 domain-containing protein [Phycicoccus sonneratiae]|uniref:DUF305 domain-containing protein n=1 Tax=Phycicoccus sonneratiae TaxID=2807628 RepID=A0ABS2CQ26_9MICO|nr:DUF305 domain-containing protein [Phycicoccus sonneraticus]MBM6401984.1 DUF305 domain-containing protein [Phycicoccus sonneraticus]
MRTTTSRRAALFAAPALLVLGLTACVTTTDDDRAPMGSMMGSRSPSTAGSPADHDQADVMFSMMMVPHHEQALEMAALVPTRSDDPALLDLARRIEAGQQPEIDRMEGWLEDWGAGSMDRMGSMGHDMGGMMSAADLRELASLEGAEFERTWLRMMVEHHEGAIDMAEDVLRRGTHAGTKDLALAIVKAQQREIDEMQAMLAG